MTKHRTIKRHRHRQRGGFWPFDSDSTSTSNGESWYQKAKNGFMGLFSSSSATPTTSYDTFVQNGAPAAAASTPAPAPAPVPVPVQAPVPAPMPMPTTGAYGDNGYQGGRRHRRRRHRGGAYTEVSGLKVAKPTYWIKGGGGSRRKTRKCRKTRKHHRH